MKRKLMYANNCPWENLTLAVLLAACAVVWLAIVWQKQAMAGMGL